MTPEEHKLLILTLGWLAGCGFCFAAGVLMWWKKNPLATLAFIVGAFNFVRLIHFLQHP